MKDIGANLLSAAYPGHELSRGFQADVASQSLAIAALSVVSLLVGMGIGMQTLFEGASQLAMGAGLVGRFVVNMMGMEMVGVWYGFERRNGDGDGDCDNDDVINVQCDSCCCGP